MLLHQAFTALGKKKEWFTLYNFANLNCISFELDSNRKKNRQSAIFTHLFTGFTQNLLRMKRFSFLLRRHFKCMYAFLNETGFEQ